MLKFIFSKLISTKISEHLFMNLFYISWTNLDSLGQSRILQKWFRCMKYTSLTENNFSAENAEKISYFLYVWVICIPKLSLTFKIINVTILIEEVLGCNSLYILCTKNSIIQRNGNFQNFMSLFLTLSVHSCLVTNIHTE